MAERKATTSKTQSTKAAAKAPAKTSAKAPAKTSVQKTDASFLGIEPYVPKKNEEYMNSAQLRHFEKILNVWKRQLMQEVDSTVGHLKEDATIYSDPLDRASQEEGFSLELRTRDRERKLIRKIEQALDAIEKGDYGFCVDCGADIGIGRLEARPTTDKCIDCKTFEEIREKQAGSVE